LSTLINQSIVRNLDLDINHLKSQTLNWDAENTEGLGGKQHSTFAKIKLPGKG